jgi:hypothetical protein
MLLRVVRVQASSVSEKFSIFHMSLRIIFSLTTTLCSDTKNQLFRVKVFAKERHRMIISVAFGTARS